MAQLDSVETQRARQTSNLKAVGSSPTVSDQNYAREKRERKRERRREEEEDEREKGRSNAFKDGTRSLLCVIDICT